MQDKMELTMESGAPVLKLDWDTVDKITRANLEALHVDLEGALDRHVRFGDWLHPDDAAKYAVTSRAIQIVLDYLGSPSER